MTRIAHLMREHLWGLRPFKRHSLVLMVAGIGYILTGSNYILATPTHARKEALVVALRWFPLDFWGTIFIIVGLASVISARWPRVSESWGYMLLTALSAGWSATYAMGVITEGAPVANLTAVLQWGLLAFLWWAIPGFVNPDKTVVVVINDNERNSDC